MGKFIDDKKKGLYRKFKIKRNDGRSEPGEKHYGCEYFVLDLNHDPHALPAIRAYRDSCENEYPVLAHDLTDLSAAMATNFMKRDAPHGTTLGVPVESDDPFGGLDRGNYDTKPTTDKRGG